MIALVLRLFTAPLGRWIGLTVAGCLVIAAYTAAIAHHASKQAAAAGETRVVTRYLKAEAKEIVRREAVIERVQVRSKKDVARIADLRAKNLKLQQEATHASHAHDSDACLGPDSVRRLAAIGPD